MIGWLKGSVVEKTDTGCILDVSGVGYHVWCSATTAASLPPEGGITTLNVYTNVRENEIALYGFATRSEKELFMQLISVSDIGPRKAVGILSGAVPSEMARAVRTGDIAFLTRLQGIGKKTAERLVVELKDKLAGFEAGDQSDSGPSAASGIFSELVSVLTNLGYKQALAERTAQRLAERMKGTEPLEELIREGLAEIKKVV
ncbi:MAG: Holliday junction branch migration protein RuvA [Myxococcota bacterium]|jgi:Holliday junction DNA helicase RuvA